jgi:hypothetical protein
MVKYIPVNEPRDIDEQSAWSRLTAEQFLAGYSEGDAVYDIDNYRLDTDAGNDTTTLDFHLGYPVVYKV